MAENRNLGKDQHQNRGLGSKDEDLQRRGDRKEMEKTGNKTTGTPRSQEEDDLDLERGKTKGARQNTGTNTRKDQEEGSQAGRSGSLGKEELKRGNQPNKGNR
jgi:hypothetical protein